MLIAGPSAETVEGQGHGDTTVVLEFDTLEVGTASNVAIFQGFEPPTS